MHTIINLLRNIVDLYYYAIIIYILLSWFPNAYGSSFHRFLHKICEPYLSIFRKIIPPIARIDFSPIIGLLVLQYATGFAFIGLETILQKLF